jgi:hypothetical protein
MFIPKTAQKARKTRRLAGKHVTLISGKKIQERNIFKK